MSEKYTASAFYCTLPDTELTAKCREWISKLCASGGKDWRLCVPVDLSNDPDILFSEVVRRFEQLRQENTELKEQLSKVATAAELLTHLNDARRSEISRLNESIQQLKAMQWAELKMRQEAEEVTGARMLELIKYCACAELYFSKGLMYAAEIDGGPCSPNEILTAFLSL